MRHVNAHADRLLIAVAHSPGRVAAAVALLCYPGFGLVLPLVLGWSVPYVVSANLMGTALAASFSLGWLAARIEARDRQHLIEWTTDLRLLDSEEFEWLVGELFKREGWTVEETGHQDRPDGNVDLVLRKGIARAIVQCKRWTSWVVGVNEIRDFGGTLMREGLPGSAGIFVTLSTFSPQAIAEARTLKVSLVDGRDLYSRVEKAKRTEPCPRCAASMVLDRPARGWWFRCVASGCSGKRDLGLDPGRAVELLTTEPISAPLRTGLPADGQPE